MSFLDPAYLTKCLQVIVADLVLAGDNAVVIALAVRNLSAREQFWGRLFGTAGAVGLRLLFIAIVTALLRIPLLQLIGGILLFYIAVKLLRPQEDHAEHNDASNAKPGTKQSLRQAVWMIIAADVVMSLDNVIAIAGVAKNDLSLAVFGLLLSIPLVVWGSIIIAKLMARLPWLIWLAGGMLGYVAAHMIFADPWVIRTLSAGPFTNQLSAMQAGLFSLIGEPAIHAVHTLAVKGKKFAQPAWYWIELVTPWILFLTLSLLGWKWASENKASHE